MNKLPKELEIQIVNALCQGMSLRAITRLLNVHRTTVMKVLIRVGDNCEALHNQHVRHLNITDVQVDEIWTFVKKKQGKCSTEEWKDSTIGDQYVFYGIDRNTKIIPAWSIGKRKMEAAEELMYGVAASLNGTIPQISSDGFQAYPIAVPRCIPGAPLATVVKDYQFDASGHGRGRYAPPKVKSLKKKAVIGDPDMDRACTSHIERANLTLRTFQRRFTRLSLGFSKKLENLKAACALHFMYYNFCWVPRTLKQTPAMAAGIADRHSP